MTKIVDVVMVHYANLEDTDACITSLLKSEYPIREIIIVDNGLDDNGAYFTKKPIKYIKTKENLGFAGGCNLGIKYSLDNKPDLILLANNDMVFEKSFLRHLVSGLVSCTAVISTGTLYYYDNPDVVWGAGGWIDWSRGLGRFYHNNSKDSVRMKDMMPITFASGCMMLVKVELFGAIGLFDESYFMYCEDLDFCIRAIRGGFSMLYVKKAIAWHKIGTKRVGENDTFFYYFLRNSILIIKKYAKIQQKVLFYFYAPFYYLSKLFMNFSLANLVAFWHGIRDGFMGTSGLRGEKYIERSKR